MECRSFIDAFDRVLCEFSAGNIKGKECVSRIDDLMAEELPDELPEDQLDDFNSFHIELGLYVEDETSRSEHPAYYGPEELLAKVTSFRSRVTRRR